MSARPQLGIIAALKREIQPLIRSRKFERATAAGSNFFRSSTAVVVCCGTGCGAARHTTNVLVETFCPEVLISIGFAGALDARMKAPAVFVPEYVVSEQSGAEFRSAFGYGRLVTAAAVANVDKKRELAARFNAQAVDMEAAAVAEVAQQQGLKFVAVKVISDDLASDMSFVGQFITPKRFRTAAFLSYVAVRPRLWPAVNELRTNSSRASIALREILELIIEKPEKLDYLLASVAEPNAVARTR
ncbi:MAG TPA: hypothetical protein VN622_15030 [Clostridia bacterium]|nr:hypothetical protein [Clostridia bacterium]